MLNKHARASSSASYGTVSGTIVDRTRLNVVDDGNEEGITSTALKSTINLSSILLPYDSDLDLEELIEQHVVKRKRSAGHAKAYEEAEDRMLVYLRMALVERDAMAVMEDEPVEQ
ncbi:hypothetical protein HDU89_002281 [Geranomyces variabilis]|nr:hypothetical protein HDU89_002281 [Geranomyces variabilis]